MYKNYDSLRTGRDAWLKNGIGENIGSPPISSKKSMYRWIVLLITFLFMVAGQQSWAQTPANYVFSATSGTYTPITIVGGATTAGVYADDTNRNLTGLPGFTVNGVTYTNYQVSDNGRLTLYTTTAPTVTTTYTALSGTFANSPVIIAPFAVDMVTSSAGSGATYMYQLIGDELVFQWENFSRWSSLGSNDIINFQVRLNTVSGDIKFVYGDITVGTLPTNTPQIGFRTSATWTTDVNNVALNITGSPTTCNWSNAVTGAANSSTMYLGTANPGVKPLSGLTYTWTKQSAPAPVRTFAAVSGITSSGATISWTAPAGATQYDVQYRQVGSCAWVDWTANPVMANTLSLTDLNAGTAYQVRVRASDGTNHSIYSHIPNAAGTGDGYVAAGTFSTLQLPCDGTPDGGISAPALTKVCAGIAPGARTVTGMTAGVSGLTYQWEESTDGGDNYVNAVGGTGSTTLTYTPPAFAGTNLKYRLRITCTASGLVGYSSVSDVEGPGAPLTQATGLTFTNVSASSATISWTNGNGTRRMVIVSDAAINDPVDDAGPALTAAALYAGGQQIVYDGTGTTVNITGLTVSSDYNVKVYEYLRCGTSAPYGYYYNVTSGTNAGVLSTCNPFPVPYNESFEDAVVPAFVACVSGTNPATRTTTTTGGQPRTGTKYQNVRWTPSGTKYIYSAPLSLIASTSYDFGAWYLTDGASGWTSIKVYVNTLPSITDAELLETATALTNTTYQRIKGTYIAPSTDTYFMIIETVNTSAPNDMSIDDLFVQESPTCLPPEDLGMAQIGATTATVSWTPSVSAPESYEWEVRTSGAAGSGATGLVTSGTALGADEEVGFSGLTATTAYVFYIRPNCGAGGFGPWESVGFTSGIANDICEDAITLNSCSGGVQTVAGTTIGSTVDLSYIDCGATGTLDKQRGVWYKYVGDNSSVTMTTCHATVGYDTRLTVYKGSCDAFICVSGNDDMTPACVSASFRSEVSFNAVEGTDYYIFVHGYQNGADLSTVGNFVLTYTCAPLCTPATDNDECEDAAEVELGVALSTHNTCSSASLGVAYPSCGPSQFATYYDSWYTFNSGSNTVLEISAVAVAPAAIGFVVYSGECGALTPVQCVALGAATNITLTADTNYYIRAFSSSAGARGAFTLLVKAPCLVPSALLVEDVTTTDANFSWAASPTDPANGYEYEVRSSGAAGSGTDGLADSGTTLAGETDASSVVLAPGTAYTLYVRSSCGASDFSAWVSKAFTTDPLCMVPTSLQVIDVTQDSATIFWTAPTTPPGEGYEYYVSEVNTAPTGDGTGTSMDEDVLLVLSPSTTYFAWVRSVCADGVESAWVAFNSFTTLCSAGTVPYVLDINAVTTPALPVCVQVENVNNDNKTWVTAAAGAGPGTIDEKSMMYPWHGSNAANDWFYLKGLSLTAGTAYVVKFTYSDWGLEEKLRVSIGDSPTAASMTTELIDITTLEDEEAHDETVPFTVAADGVYYIGFQAHSDADMFNLYVGKISVDFAPSCVAVASVMVDEVTNDSARLSWPASVSAPSEGYEYYLSQTNVAPLVDTPATDDVGAGVLEKELTGLTDSMTYYAWVRAVCGLGDVSAWTAAAPFTTLCNAGTVPYVLNIDTVTVPALPVCVQSEDVNGDDYTWFTVNSSTQTSGIVGKVMAYAYNDEDDEMGADDWFFLKGLNLTAGTNYELKFKCKNRGYIEKLRASIGNNPTAAAMATELTDIETEVTTAVFDETVPFTVTTDGVYYIGFQAHSDADQWMLYVGEISVDVALSTPGFDLSKLSYYPNPVQDVLTLNHVDAIDAVEVFNILGQKVYQKDFASTEAKVDMAKLPAGTYIVNVVSKGLTKNIKVIKK